MNMKNAGVTVIELIIVISLLGLALLAVVPSLAKNDERHLTLSVYRLQNDLRYARRLSLSETVYARIVFDPIQGRYSIQKETESGNREIKTSVLSGGVSLKSVNAPSQTVVYTPRGTVQSACTIVMSCGKYEQSLTVNVGSGRVKIANLIKK